MARSRLLPLSSLSLLHIHENQILFCLSWLKDQFAKVFSEHSHQIYQTWQQHLCTECVCNTLPIHLWMQVCSLFPSLWLRSLWAKQNSLARAQQGSNGARHLWEWLWHLWEWLWHIWEWLLAPLGAGANPVPTFRPPGSQSWGL